MRMGRWSEQTSLIISMGKLSAMFACTNVSSERLKPVSILEHRHFRRYTLVEHSLVFEDPQRADRRPSFGSALVKLVQET